jgi:hypothetical protein
MDVIVAATPDSVVVVAGFRCLDDKLYADARS